MVWITRRVWLAVLGFAAVGFSRSWAIEPQEVTFQTFDGVKISADYYPPKKGAANAPGAGSGAPMVILLHMYGQDRASWKPLIEPLHNAGFAILAPDLRGHGQSATENLKERVEKRETRLFKAMEQDVRAAYEWLAEQKGVDRARFVLVGASVGCSIALQYAALDKSVDAVVCLSPGLNYLGLDSKRDMRKVMGRKILLLATEEEKDAAEALKPLADGAQAKIHDGAAHGTNMLGLVPNIEKDIVDFLKRSAGEPVRDPCYGSLQSEIYHRPDERWIEQIKPANLRYYSTPAEAESRGLRASKTKEPRPEKDEKNKPGTTAKPEKKPSMKGKP